MKIYSPNISTQTIGGGWTFLRNLKKVLKDKVEFVDNYEKCDIYLITSVTIVDKKEVSLAISVGKKIVLRVDNMPKKSRNGRMSPHERMRDFANSAKAIVYQSNWAKDWIGSYLGHPEKSIVISNGVDDKIFHPIKKESKDYEIFLIVHYNRDENKRIPEALDWFTKVWLGNNKNKLIIIGRFSPDIVQAKFDFFRGENYEYVGIVDNPIVMANYMQKADVLLYPSYSDACPNTVIEAKSCGMEVWHNGYAGVSEACNIEDKSLKRMGEEYYNLFNQLT